MATEDKTPATELEIGCAIQNALEDVLGNYSSLSPRKIDKLFDENRNAIVEHTELILWMEGRTVHTEDIEKKL